MFKVAVGEYLLEVINRANADISLIEQLYPFLPVSSGEDLGKGLVDLLLLVDIVKLMRNEIFSAYDFTELGLEPGLSAADREILAITGFVGIHAGHVASCWGFGALGQITVQ